SLRRGLSNLQTAEFLYEARLFPDLEYTFKHALTHDVAYRSLIQERRRALHRQIVETIERLHPDRLAEQIERLAHHAIGGEAWGRPSPISGRLGPRPSPVRPTGRRRRISSRLSVLWITSRKIGTRSPRPSIFGS